MRLLPEWLDFSHAHVVSTRGSESNCGDRALRETAGIYSCSPSRRRPELDLKKSGFNVAVV